MKWLTNLRIKYKILLVATAGIAGFCIYFAFNVSVAYQNNARLEGIRTIHFPILQSTNSTIVMLDKLKQTLQFAATTAEVDVLRDADAQAEAIRQNLQRIIEMDRRVTEEALEIDTRFKAYYAAARAFAKQVAEGNAATSTTDMSALIDAMQQLLQRLETSLKDFRESNYTKFTGAIENANKSSQDAIKVGLVIAILTIVVLVGNGYLITSLIVGNIQMILRSLKEIANGGGDLTKRLKSHSADEFGELVDSFNLFIARLQEIIGRVLESAQVIAETSRQVSAGNMDLSIRTENQASSLEETSANMEEMTGTVKQNADNTHETSEMANTTQELAQRASAVMNDLSVAMANISDSSRKIADITTVIDGITFQTNLLSLNAAVEAAHAGNKGYGFAVVASEVRNLSGKAAESAKEIRNLIKDSARKVQQGTELVNQSSVQLQDILESAKKMAEIVSSIAAASSEQATGILQVNQAIASVDVATQENSRLVEQLSSASKVLEDQAQLLYSLLRAFKIDNSSATRVETAPENSNVRANNASLYAYRRGNNPVN